MFEGHDNGIVSAVQYNGILLLRRLGALVWVVTVMAHPAAYSRYQSSGLGAVDIGNALQDYFDCLQF